MKSILIIFFLIFCTTAVKAQTYPPNQTADSDLVFVTVQIEAQFPGGSAAWELFLKNYKLKSVATPSSNVATVFFIVDSHGHVSKTSVENASVIDKDLLKQIETMLKEMPQWKPTVQNGYNVTFKVKRYVTSS